MEGNTNYYSAADPTGRGPQAGDRAIPLRDCRAQTPSTSSCCRKALDRQARASQGSPPQEQLTPPDRDDDAAPH